MLRFRFLGIPVQIHWMFFLLAAFLGGALRANGPEDLARVVVVMAVVFIGLMVHEYGHALTGRHFGASRPEVTLHGMGGYAQFPGTSFTTKERIRMILAGPWLDSRSRL